MKSLQKPFGDSIWILNGGPVFTCVCNYSFFCASVHVTARAGVLCRNLCKWKLREHVLYVCVCVCVWERERECVCACLCLQMPRTSHDSQLRHNTHRQVWGLEGARAQIAEHGLAEQILLSLSLSHSVSVCLSLSLSAFSLFHCANTEGLFVIQSRKCKLSQIWPALLFDTIPSLFLRPPIAKRSASCSISREHGNKGSSDEIDPMISSMSGFKCGLRWHLG